MSSYLVLIYIMSFHFIFIDYSIVQFQSLLRTYAQPLYTIPIVHPLLLNIRRRILLPTIVPRIRRIPRLRRTDTAAFEITCFEGSKKYTSVHIVQLHQELTKKMSGQAKKCNATYCPVLAFTPPSGISRFEPAPLAAEPYVTSAPGNFFSTLSSTPDSVAIRTIKLAKVHSTVAEPFCYSQPFLRFFVPKTMDG
jgi:hypothetical protein